MCLDPLVFCMLMIYWDSVPNHNRQIIASNASVHIHSHPLLVGCYTPAGHRIYSVAARSANTFEGYVKPIVIDDILLDEIEDGLDDDMTNHNLCSPLFADAPP